MSINNRLDVEFHWADYLVFSLSLGLGLVVGVVFLFKGGKQKTNDEYLLGGRDLNVVTVGASMLTSILNAVFLLGGVAEVYYRGAIYSLMGVSFLPILFIVVIIFVPLWRKVNTTSAYEYLELRFDSVALRLWGALLFSTKLILFLAVVFYTPAMALSQVAGINIHIAIVVCGVVCALYTVLGGLKAVVWTDTIQAFIMLTGLLVLCVMGTIEAGGPTYVLDTAKDIGRFNFDNFNPDPRERHSVWSLVIGYTFTWLFGYLSDQMIIQRYQSVKTTRAAQWAVFVCTIVGWVCLALVVAVGIIASVFYKDCDPLIEGEITAGDQLLPFFFMELLGPYKGLPGLFIASIFAAALSTVSSTINSLSAVFLEDFIKPFKKFIGNPVSQMHEHIYAKVLSGIFGFLAIALSYIAPLLGKAIIQVPPTVYGAVGGPLFAIFFLGFFVPCANKWGALFGSLLGVLLDLWIGIGAISNGKQPKEDNLPVGMCMFNETYNDTSTATLYTFSTEIVTTSMPETNPLQDLYDVSYVWIGVIGVFTSVICGILISLITNACGLGQSPGSYDPALLWACDDKCLCCCPGAVKSPWQQYKHSGRESEKQSSPINGYSNGSAYTIADKKNGFINDGYISYMDEMTRF